MFRARETAVKRDIVISNKLGMHARPASLIVQTASRFRSDVRVIKNKQEIDGKSILGLLMLAAGQGTTLTLAASGEDAVEAVDALEQLFNSKFGEE
jgi:phosphocarrier protein